MSSPGLGTKVLHGVLLPGSAWSGWEESSSCRPGRLVPLLRYMLKEAIQVGINVSNLFLRDSQCRKVTVQKSKVPLLFIKVTSSLRTTKAMVQIMKT